MQLLDLQVIDYQFNIFMWVIRFLNFLVESGSVVVRGFLYICI